MPISQGKDFKGLSDSEVIQRRYEFGKNTIKLKRNVLNRIYKKSFENKVYVIRNNELKRIKTEMIVPGDIISVKKGSFLPCDGKVIESNNFEVESAFANFESNNIVFQGTKVLEGTALIEATRIGEDTKLGGIVKELDNYKKENPRTELQKWINYIGTLGMLFLLFGVVFSLATVEGDIIYVMSRAAYAGLLLFASTVPFGFILLFIAKLFELTRTTKKSNLFVKYKNTFSKVEKISVICVDDKFFTEDSSEYIQNFYKSGIRIVVISDKKEEEVVKIAVKAGVCDKENAISITGSEIDNSDEEQLIKLICESIIFCEMTPKHKEKLIKAFNRINVKTIAFGDKMEDTLTINYANIGISTHSKKRHIEWETAKGVIYSDKFEPIYNFVKSGLILGENFRNFILFSLIFHIPVILLLFIALLAQVDLGNFAFQTTMMVFAIIPLMIVLVNAECDDTFFDTLQNKKKEFYLNCIKGGFLAIAVTGLLMFEFLIMHQIIPDELTRVNILVITATILYGIIIIFQKNLKGKKTREPQKEKKDKILKKKEEQKVKEKVPKKKPKKEKEDIGGNVI